MFGGAVVQWLSHFVVVVVVLVAVAASVHFDLFSSLGRTLKQ